jgi:hypothetical protein
VPALLAAAKRSRAACWAGVGARLLPLRGLAALRGCVRALVVRRAARVAPPAAFIFRLPILDTVGLLLRAVAEPRALLFTVTCTLTLGALLLELEPPAPPLPPRPPVPVAAAAAPLP